MDNISFKRNYIEFNEGVNYLIIDALYFTCIKTYMIEKGIQIKINDDKTLIFPYNEIPFTWYKAESNFLYIHQIKKFNYSDLQLHIDNAFSSDTGLILCISEGILYSVLNDFNFDDLVDSNSEPICFDYWQNLTNKFQHKDIGLILPTGIDSGFEFEGSGIYYISKQNLVI